MMRDTRVYIQSYLFKRKQTCKNSTMYNGIIINKLKNKILMYIAF